MTDRDDFDRFEEDEAEEENVESKPLSLNELRQTLFRLINATTFEQGVVLIVILNFIVSFIRPQSFPGLAFLGTLRVPFILTMTVCALWIARLNRGWTKQTKLILGLLIFEGARGLLGRYWDPADTIVRNDFWHFHVWKDLAMQFTSLVFPLAVFLTNGKSLERFCSACIFVSVVLAYYSINHGGRGPGGFVGDENDLCFVLVMLLPFSLVRVAAPGGMLIRGVRISAAVIVFGGIVASFSRGGFLGLVALLCYIVFKSKRKMVAVSLAVILGLLVVPFVSTTYWHEMRSIESEIGSESGTIRQRLDMWSLAFKVWSDPRNIVFGVGLKNSPYWIKDYESPGQHLHKKSFAGRVMHSLYFELLPDMGLIGIFFVGGAVMVSFVLNYLYCQQARLYLRRIALVFERFKKLELEPLNTGPDLESQAAERKQIASLITTSRTELERIQILFMTVNASWVGVLVAGLGISVLYYPPLWMLIGLSAALQLYWKRMAPTIQSVAGYTLAATSTALPPAAID